MVDLVKNKSRCAKTVILRNIHKYILLGIRILLDWMPLQSNLDRLFTASTFTYTNVFYWDSLHETIYLLNFVQYLLSYELSI